MFCKNCGKNILIISTSSILLLIFIIGAALSIMYSNNTLQKIIPEIINCKYYQEYSDDERASGYIQCALDKKIPPLNKKYLFKEQDKYWEEIGFILEHYFEDTIKYQNKQPELIGKYNTMDKIYLATYKESTLYNLGSIALGLSEYAGPDYMYGNGTWEQYIEVTKSENVDFKKLSSKEQIALAKNIQKQVKYLSDKFASDYYKKVYITELMGIEYNSTNNTAKIILKNTIEFLNDYNPKDWYKEQFNDSQEQIDSLDENDKYNNANFSREEMIKGYDFAEKIKLAVKNQDIETFADYIYYPLTINVNDKNIEISDKNQFLNYDYEKIFTENFIKTVCENEIFVNYRGFMLGNGEIWFSYPNNSDTPKIYHINIMD